MRKILTNVPWKNWKTRKFSFIYCMVMGTAIIVVGAVATFVADFDTAAWMEYSMGFLKFMIGTGTLITILPLKDVIQFLSGNYGGDEE